MYPSGPSLFTLTIKNSDPSELTPYIRVTNKGIKAYANFVILPKFDEHQNITDRLFYTTITTGMGNREIYLYQAYVEIPNHSGLADITAGIKINRNILVENNELKYPNINIKISNTDKHPGEMGVAMAVESGIFFKTTVPLKLEDD